jgi:hypothetical protein
MVLSMAARSNEGRATRDALFRPAFPVSLRVPEA